MSTLYRAALLLVAALAFSGCGTLRTGLNLPIGGRPSVNSSVSIPLGK